MIKFKTVVLCLKLLSNYKKISPKKTNFVSTTQATLKIFQMLKTRHIFLEIELWLVPLKVYRENVSSLK